MVEGGYIRLFRSMRDWEWYGDEAATTLFLHLLLNANFRPGRFRGKEVLPGQMVTSMERIREALGWSRGKVRHTLEKLRSSGDITIQTTNHLTTLTLVSWAKYQDVTPAHNQPNSQPTTDRQPSEQPTNSRPLATIEEEREEEESKKEKKNGALSSKEGLDEKFELLWTTFQRHGVKSKAMSYWRKLSPEDRDTILAKAPEYVKHTSGPNAQFRSYLEGWINPANRKWERPLVERTNGHAPPNTIPAGRQDLKTTWD